MLAVAREFLRVVNTVFTAFSKFLHVASYILLVFVQYFNIISVRFRQ